jgi:hypothetical protein
MYISSLTYKRSVAQKADPFLSWKRTDKEFFAAGACHILAYMFLQLHPNENWSIIHIKPKRGYSGNHVYVTNGTWAFDYHGWTLEKELLEETQKAYTKEYKGWQFERVIVQDDLETFCRANDHCPPSYFPYLPWERGYNYIKQFPDSPTS